VQNSPFTIPAHFGVLDHLLDFAPKKTVRVENNTNKPTISSSVNNCNTNSNQTVNTPFTFTPINNPFLPSVSPANNINSNIFNPAFNPTFNPSSQQNINNNNNIKIANVERNEGKDVVFTMKEVKAIVEKALQVETAKIKDQYDQILLERLEEQYNMFSKFNEDNISRHIQETECPYLS
jgi:hypothetical protein